MQRLRQHLTSARAGEGSAVVVRGEAGVGKTRLLAELANEARTAGSFVLRGRCTELAASAYRPLSEALLGLARQGLDRLAPQLAPFRPALGQLVPQWREPGFVVSDETDVVIGEAVVQLLTACAASEPCVLVLEDLHWADPDTLAIVEYLADNIAATHSLVLVTARNQFTGRGSELLAGLVQRRAAELIDLGRLPDVAMRELVRSILDDVSDGVADDAARRADGLPFLLEEVLGAAVEAGELAAGERGWEWRGEPSVLPASVADTVEGRMRALPGQARTIVEAAALTGSTPSPAVLAAALDVSEEAVLAALQSAIDVELMTSSGDSLQFRHALTREAIAGAMPVTRKIPIARALAHAMETSDALLAATLYRTACDGAAAAQALMTAARTALQAGALSTAVTIAESASALDGVTTETACGLDEVLTEALTLAGQWERVFEFGNHLLGVLLEMNAPAGRRARVHMHIARAALAASLFDLALSHTRAAAMLVGQDDEERLQPRIDALNAGIAIESGRLDDARSLASQALASAERQSLTEVACEALEVLGRLERLRDTRAAESMFQRGVELATARGLIGWRIRGMHELGIAEMFRGEHATLETARDLAMSAGMYSVAADIDHQLVGLHVFRLEPEALIDAAERALAGARRLRLDASAAMAHIHAATGHAMRGRTDEAEARVSAAVQLAPDLPDVLIYTWAHVRGLASLLREDRSSCRDHLAHAIELANRNPAAPPAAHRALWPLLSALDGDAAAVDAMRPHAGGSTITRGFIAYADAVLAGARGDAAAAITRVGQGDAATSLWRGFHHLGRRLVAEAALRDGWADPAPWLRDLIVHFDALGFPHVVAACRTMLREAGAPVPRPRRGGPAVPEHLARLGVTGRELEVMRLLHDGLTNAEIAARLVLSSRTVEKHVDNLKAKTGAANRRELVRMRT